MTADELVKLAELLAARLGHRPDRDPDELLTQPESGLTRHEWLGAIHRNEVTYLKVGRRYYVRRRHLEARQNHVWLAGQVNGGDDKHHGGHQAGLLTVVLRI